MKWNSRFPTNNFPAGVSQRLLKTQTCRVKYAYKYRDISYLRLRNFQPTLNESVFFDSLAARTLYVSWLPARKLYRKNKFSAFCVQMRNSSRLRLDNIQSRTSRQKFCLQIKNSVEARMYSAICGEVVCYCSRRGLDEAC